MWQEPGAGVRQAPAFARVDREQFCASALVIDGRDIAVVLHSVHLLAG
jgi:hypothetical protein